jgi:hypothetical protein
MQAKPFLIGIARAGLIWHNGMLRARCGGGVLRLKVTISLSAIRTGRGRVLEKMNDGSQDLGSTYS